MMLFQRRLFFELVGNAVTAVFLLLFVLVLASSLQVLQQVQGLSALTFLKSVPIFAASALDLVLPVATLVAVVLTYGRAAADNEVDTLRASGVHPFHLLVPGLVFGALMMLALLWASDEGTPLAERAKRRLTTEEDKSALVAAQLGSGEPVSIDSETTLTIGSIDEHGNARGILIQIWDEHWNLVRMIRSATGRIYVDETRGELVVELHDFHTVIGEGRSSGSMTIRRPILSVAADLPMRTFTTAQLIGWEKRNERDGRRRGQYRPLVIATEIAMRLSGSASCLLFVLLGFPVALRFRRSDRVGAFLVAFLLALFVYFPTVKVARTLASSKALPPEIAAWTGQAALLLLGLALSWRIFRR
ncbi:MAG: LptF/LptG family permease [Planctomycetes bacterium]|nr:LptF/LptG family permease [Planctomycetota bacterium]